MKRTLIVWIVCILGGAGHAAAQWPEYTLDDPNTLNAGIGMTWIGDKSYYGMTLQPDLSIGKFGIGLNIDLLFNTETGGIRRVDWNSGYDYARMIRYLRWGKKGDTFYTRAGILDRARIGHGSLLNYYQNSLNYDGRKLGLVLDADFGRFGFETMASNLGRMEVIGGRFYVRPLHTSSIPVIRSGAVGASYVTDRDPDAHVASSDGVQAFSVDVELPLIKTDFWNVLLYADHAQIIDYGNGQAIGIGTGIDLLGGFLHFSANYERRFMGESYIPTFFGPFYEVMRYSASAELIAHYISLGGDSLGIPADVLAAPGSAPIPKHRLLPMMTSSRRGWYGGVSFDFLHLIKMIGTYEKVDDAGNSGIMHLEARLSRSIPFIALDASYDKWGIRRFGDLTTLDYRSSARLGIGYKIRPYLLLFLDYIWSFQWDESRGQYAPQERFQPRLSFSYDLGNLGL